MNTPKLSNKNTKVCHSTISELLLKYPPKDKITRSSDDAGTTHYFWTDINNNDVSIATSRNSHDIISVDVKSNDYGEKQVMMKLVSVGYSFDNVHIMYAMASLIEEIFCA